VLFAGINRDLQGDQRKKISLDLSLHPVQQLSALSLFISFDGHFDFSFLEVIAHRIARTNKLLQSWNYVKVVITEGVNQGERFLASSKR